MKYIVYIHVYVLHILNQQSSVKISLAIQKRKLLKQLALINMAFTKYGIIFIYMYLKKNLIITLSFLGLGGAMNQHWNIDAMINPYSGTYLDNNAL